MRETLVCIRVSARSHRSTPEVAGFRCATARPADYMLCLPGASVCHLSPQPWHWYDLMCTHAISAGLLEAYMTLPPWFVQDGCFSLSQARPRGEMTLNSESGAGDSTGRLDRGSADRAVSKSARIHGCPSLHLLHFVLTPSMYPSTPPYLRKT